MNNKTHNKKTVKKRIIRTPAFIGGVHENERRRFFDLGRNLVIRILKNDDDTETVERWVGVGSFGQWKTVGPNDVEQLAITNARVKHWFLNETNLLENSKLTAI